MTRVVVTPAGPRNIRGWRPRPRQNPTLLRAAPSPPGGWAGPSECYLIDQIRRFQDQGAVGDCVGAATTYIDEAVAGTGSPPKSRLYVYGKGRQREGTPLEEDSGMSCGDGVAVAEECGIATEAAWSDDDPEARYVLDPSPADGDAALRKSTLSYQLRTLDQMLYCISQGFPFLGGYSVPANMMTEACAESGKVHFFAPGEQSIGGHAQAHFGFDVNKMIGPYRGAMLCPNSWGQGWGATIAGERGYAWWPFEFVRQQMAEDFWTIRAVTG